MLLTLMLWRNQPIKLPQISLSLFNMILAIVIFVVNVRFDGLVDHACCFSVRFRVVVEPDGDVLYDYADEGFGGLVFAGAADVDVGGGDCVEVDDYVEGWEADGGVEVGDVGGQGGFGFGVLEDARRVVDLPERHDCADDIFEFWVWCWWLVLRDRQDLRIG